MSKKFIHCTGGKIYPCTRKFINGGLGIFYPIPNDISMTDLRKLVTETANPKSQDLDRLPILQILQIINEEDQLVAQAVQKELPVIAQVVEDVVRCLSDGGRLFLCGAGTSGRIALCEASECPPTFSTSPEMVQALMAGAPESFFKAVEGAEDVLEAGEADLKKRNFSGKDMVIGISASGRTPYVCGALAYSKKLNAKNALLCSSKPEKSDAKFIIAPYTGPEVLTGSTRLKAATAAKMVLNMITTTSMVRLGKVYRNLMVDVSPNSEKLVDRASRIVETITGCSKEEALKLMKTAKNAKVAAVMYKKKVSKEEAIKLIEKNNGQIRPILES